MARGEHFFVWRRFRGVPFQHHAIDVGDDTVVHFSDGQHGIAGPFGATANFAILRTPLADLVAASRDGRHIVEHATDRTPDEIVERAISQVGQRGYDLVFNNCEHFAYWCVFDSHSSVQVEVACERVSSAGVKAVLAAAGRAAPRLGVNTVTRGLSPWMVAADLAQWATEAGGHHLGLRNPLRRRRVGRAVGGATAVGIGAVAGPLGVVIAGGTWFAGEVAAEVGRRAYHRLRESRGPMAVLPSADELASGVALDQPDQVG